MTADWRQHHHLYLHLFAFLSSTMMVVPTSLLQMILAISAVIIQNHYMSNN